MNSNYNYPSQLIIATYNIQTWLNRKNILGNIAEMKKNGVNILCLQECKCKGGEKYLKQVFREVLPDWQIVTYIPEEGGDNDGLLCAWDRKFIGIPPNVKSITLPAHHKTYFERRIMQAGNTKRSALIITFDYGQGRSFKIVNTHLDLAGGNKHRGKQLRALKIALEQSPAKCTIICGDLNTIGIAKFRNRSLLKNNLFSDIIDISAGIHHSHDIFSSIDPACKPYIFKCMSLLKNMKMHFYSKLDYILTAGEGIQCNEVYAINVTGSDHLPIIAKLTIGDKSTNN